tara:strand:- start:6 stop:800 length:795 start_codon:yes stop_codon:yes gene_type:complete
MNNDILINGKFYNTGDIFSVNPDMEIEIEEFHNNKIIRIDNFYRNPDLVRKLALSSVATREANFGYPGFRSSFKIGQGYNIPIYEDIIKSVFLDFKQLYNYALDTINFNFAKSSKVYDWDSNKGNNACHPHKDFTVADEKTYGSVIFLNTEDEFEEDKNGTAFYKHIPTGISDCNREVYINYYYEDDISTEYIINDIFFKDSKICDDWINDGNEYWEMVHLSKMKYNRMILYPSSYFHTAYFNNQDWDNDNHRIVQALFLHGPM